MSNQVPVACSLSGADATIRAAELAQLGDRSLLEAHVNEGHAILRFTTDARTELNAVIEAESKCCPFFEFDLTEHPEALTLKVTAPEHAEMAVAELVSAFKSEGSVV